MFTSIPLLFKEAAEKALDRAAYIVPGPDGQEKRITYSELLEDVKNFACGLISLGLGGKKMISIADNCAELPVVVLGSMAAGGIDVEKEASYPSGELSEIFSIMRPEIVCLRDRTSLEKYQRLSIDRSAARIFFEPEGITLDENDFTMAQVLAKGLVYREKNPEAFERALSAIRADAVATIVFTSGTTGTPKGVSLSHGNVSFAVREFGLRAGLREGETYLSVIHIRHIGEKLAIFMGLTTGYSIVLSSPSRMREDMASYRPQVLAGSPVHWKIFMDAVSKKMMDTGKFAAYKFFYAARQAFLRARRILSGRSAEPAGPTRAALSPFILAATFPLSLLGDALVFSKIREITGGRVRIVVSGGAFLHDEIDDFFEAIGIPLVNGYGSNETSAVVMVRDAKKNVRHTIGWPVPETKIRLVDPVSGEAARRFAPGILQVKGPQVFSGYFGNEAASAKALSPDGYYDTGDIVQETATGSFKFVGRSKDTISLLDRNNVEPEPIEKRLEGSPFIRHAIVTGQDRRSLGVLIHPNEDSIRAYLGLPPEATRSSLIDDPRVTGLLQSVIDSLIRPEYGFQDHELLRGFSLVFDGFSPGDLLTTTMKKRRGAILERYSKEIEGIYARIEA